MCITTSCINDGAEKKFIEIGISAEFISKTHCDIERVWGIKEGTSQLISMTVR